MFGGSAVYFRIDNRFLRRSNMKKKIFTPFTVVEAGGLATVLQYKDDIQKGKKGLESGEYRGFKTDDYVFAPPKEGDVYAKTHQLEHLTDSTDQLYINGHCNSGLDYLATNAACNSDKKVTIGDLIDQLKAHGFPATSQAKVKLWACKGGQRDGTKESFAAAFSRKMWEAGYQKCKIFGYRRSVFQKFMKDGSDEYHKWAADDTSAVTQEQKIALAIEGNGADNKRARMIWETELRTTGQDSTQAIKNIVESPFKIRSFPGLASAARRGPRASDPAVRIQFSNGQEVERS
jgi:hypothetical protein